MAKSFEEVLGEVVAIFRRDVLNDDSILLKYETTANDVTGWDSLSHIELVIATEQHFKIRFNFAELQKFKNVGEMCDSIVVETGEFLTRAAAPPGRAQRERSNSMISVATPGKASTGGSRVGIAPAK